MEVVIIFHPGLWKFAVAALPFKALGSLLSRKSQPKPKTINYSSQAKIKKVSGEFQLRSEASRVGNALAHYIKTEANLPNNGYEATVLLRTIVGSAHLRHFGQVSLGSSILKDETVLVDSLFDADEIGIEEVPQRLQVPWKATRPGLAYRKSVAGNGFIIVVLSKGTERPYIFDIIEYPDIC